MTTAEEEDSTKAASVAAAGSLDLFSKNSKRQRRMLDWRMDPAESRSDFSIEIVAVDDLTIEVAPVGKQGMENNQGETTAVTTYHVHKQSLEYEPNSSLYFACIFANQTAESMSNKVRIQLNLQTDEVFPILLDYVYGLDEGKPDLTIANAALLYHLADYLEVESTKILHFWKKKISVDDLAISCDRKICMEDLATCLQQAGKFHIEPLREIVVKMCADNISAVAINSPLLEVSDSKFWLDVRAQMEKSCSSPLHILLYVVSEFCFRQKDVLDAETFKQLVPHPSRDDLPSYETAVKLLVVEKAIRRGAMEESEEITDDQHILLESLTRDWRQWSDPMTIQDLMKKMSPHLFSRAVVMSREIEREEKKALGLMFDNSPKGLPTNISVTGAGIAEFNGVYSLYDSEDIQYCMNGLLEGRVVEFKIELWNLSSQPFWGIAVSDSSMDCAEYDSLPYTDARLSRLPPVNGWMGCDNSRPVLTYHFD